MQYIFAMSVILSSYAFLNYFLSFLLCIYAVLFQLSLVANTRLSWVHSGINKTETTSIIYSNRNRSLSIPTEGLYSIHVSLSFEIKNVTRRKILSCKIYRKHKQDELISPLMYKFINVTRNGKEMSYVDIDLSGLFNLEKDDDIFVMADDATDILRYVVCNYLGVYRVSEVQKHNTITTLLYYPNTK